MKKLLFINFLLLFCLFSACDKFEKSHSLSTGDGSNGPVITFDESSFNFGVIESGAVVSHIFKFKNTGKSPLIIKNVTTQCGCTIPTKPEKPIAPGETNEIKVQFNSNGKSGMQKKLVTITANTQPEQAIIEIMADVKQ